jgi:peptidoglycan/xylan/chitin deacetylase (PgdA/CDA1 family)
MYHYIRETDTRDAPSTRDLSMDPQDFRKHLSYIQQLEKEKKIHLMNGIDFYNSLSTGCFPAKNIWIFTSDDGWSDTYTNLVPIATEYHIPFFI